MDRSGTTAHAPCVICVLSGRASTLDYGTGVAKAMRAISMTAGRSGLMLMTDRIGAEWYITLNG